MRFPFTLLWPDGEVDHDLVFAATVSEDRAGWTKALNKTLKALKAAAPTSGWLLKQGGRNKAGFASILARDKRRWFVLTQPEDDGEATFRYYDSPPINLATTTPRGAIVLNRSAVLAMDGESKLHNAFKITSKVRACTSLQGARSPRHALA